MLAGMKTASKCMEMGNGTMFTPISAAQQCTNSPPIPLNFSVEDVGKGRKIDM